MCHEENKLLLARILNNYNFCNVYRFICWALVFFSNILYLNCPVFETIIPYMPQCGTNQNGAKRQHLSAFAFLHDR